MGGFSVKIEGLEQLKAKLDNMAGPAAERAIRKALAAGAEVERAAVVERAPVKVGSGGILPENALRNDIEVHVHKGDQGGFYAVIGPGKLTSHVARWVEYGHRLVAGGRSSVLPSGKTKGPGKQVGTVPAHPFIRPAYEATREAATTAIVTTLASEIEKDARRNA